MLGMAHMDTWTHGHMDTKLPAIPSRCHTRQTRIKLEVEYALNLSHLECAFPNGAEFPRVTTSRGRWGLSPPHHSDFHFAAAAP
eukprot:COSAG01_NODE_6866_length_3464_cov_14.077266_1_plen_84_part_00